MAKKKLFRMNIIVDYSVDPSLYGIEDPEEMMRLDKDHLMENPDDLAFIISDSEYKIDIKYVGESGNE